MDKVAPRKILGYYKRKNSVYSEEPESGRHHLKQVIKVNITSKEPHRHQVPPDVMHKEEQKHHSWDIHAKNRDLCLLMKEQQTNPKSGSLYK